MNLLNTALGERRSLLTQSLLPEKGSRTKDEEKMQQVRWVRPKLVIEVVFNDRTREAISVTKP